MEIVTIRLDDIYVPAKRRKTLNMQVVAELAESILDHGQEVPILLRRDHERYVLVEGLHRLEACRALGELEIQGMIVQARRH
jgi:ParB-like chromosome segregation protein Spo0J